MRADLREKLEALAASLRELRPLAPTELDRLKAYFKVRLTWSSNALEGNTLTEVETKSVIEEGLTVAGKPLRDHLEATGHAHAYDFMWELARRSTIEESDILRLHRLFFEAIDASAAGSYRSVRAFITGTRFVPPNPARVGEQMNAFLGEVALKRANLHPIEFAAWLHLRLVSIHPFVDGNGRTARLLMNVALLQSGYPIALIKPANRATYAATLARCQENAEEEPFFEFVAERVLESGAEYVRLVTAG